MSDVVKKCLIQLYMRNLGKKINKGVRRLTKKIDKGSHRLGQKTKGVLNKAEKINNRIIAKSGKALNVSKKVLGVADSLVHGLNEAGVSSIPLVGSATKLLETGVHQGNRAVSKADKLHDKYERKSKKAIKKANKKSDSLSKFNSRKHLQKIANEESGSGFR